MSSSEPTGTWVEVTELYEPELLREGRIVWDLAVQLCGYLLAHPAKNLRVNQKPVAIDVLLENTVTETIEANESEGVPEAKLTHLNLRSSLARDKFPAHLLFTAQGITVQAIELNDPPSPTYVGLAESPYFEEMVTSNRAAFHEMDTTFVAVRNAIAVQIAWVWLRFQPQSAVTQWYQDRFASAGPRARKIGIVAIARRVLIDLWRYLEAGVVPPRALFKAPVPARSRRRAA